MATDSVSLSPVNVQPEPLAGAFLWTVLFMVVYFARPEDWIPGLHVIPLAKIAGIMALIALVLAIGQVRQKFPREVIFLLLLLVQLSLTVPFSPVWRGGAFAGVVEFSKCVPIVVVMSLAVRSLTRLRRLIFIQAACVAIIAPVTIWKGRASGGRLEGVLNGNYSNPNDLALALAITLPICLFFFFRCRSMVRKAVWGLAMLVMVYVIFLTASRAGLLSIGTAAAVCLWEFAVRGRRRYLFAIVAVAGIAFWVYAGRGVKERFDANAQSTNQEQESAYGSREARWNLLITSLKVTAEHPIFGIGPGNFPIVSGVWHVTHNSYTQMSAEGGIPAFILYILILWCGFANIRATKRLARGPTETRFLAGALRASLAAFVVGSFFGSDAYQLFTYFLVGYTTALYYIARRQAEEIQKRDQPRVEPESIVSEIAAPEDVSAWSTY